MIFHGFVSVGLVYSLTEISSKGSHFAIKERSTQKHTNKA